MSSKVFEVGVLILLMAPLESARILVCSGFFWKIWLRCVSWLITREGEACLEKLDLVMGELQSVC